MCGAQGPVGFASILAGVLDQLTVRRGGPDDSELLIGLFAGAPGLVSWYQQQGFIPTDRYERRGFTGQIFSMPVG